MRNRKGWKDTGGHPQIENDPNFLCECDDPTRRGCDFPECKIALLREAKQQAKRDKKGKP